MKRSVRFFFIAFFCSLATAGLLMGFLVADRNTRLTGLRENEPFFTVQPLDALHYDIQLFGEEAVLSLDWLNEAARNGQRLFCFAPAGARLLLRLSSAVL